jgi:YD repeat-containing protein
MKARLFSLMILLGTMLSLPVPMYAQVEGSRILPPGVDVGSAIPLPSVSPTGSVGFSVPLWRIETGSVSLPLTLSYNSNGIRVNDVPSETGLGWALFTGGTISRSVNIFPDEYTGVGPNDTTYQSWFQIDPYQLSCKLDTLKKFYDGKWDFSPDLFMINLPVAIGEFLFDNDSTLHLNSSDQADIAVSWHNDIINWPDHDDIFRQNMPLDILYNPEHNDYRDTINWYFGSINFEVNDLIGNRFVFRPVEHTYTKTTRTSPFEEQYDSLVYTPYGQYAYRSNVADLGYITGWALDSVVTVKGDTIIFHYSDKLSTTQFEHTVSQELTATQRRSCYASFFTTWDPINEEYFSGIEQGAEYWETIRLERITRLLPDSITTSTENVSFKYETDGLAAGNETPSSSMRLAEVIVSDKFRDDTVSVIGLDYGYYNGTEFTKLRLDGIEFFGNSKLNQPKTIELKYIEGTLPEVGSTQQDLYGYHNSNTSSHMLPLLPAQPASFSPEFIDGFDYNAADRSIDPSRITIGMLSKITFPAGGSVEIEYEPNSEYDSAPTYPTTRLAPGVRVNSVILMDESGFDISKRRYNYIGLSGYYHNENSYTYYYQESSSEYTSPHPEPFYEFIRYSSNINLKLISGLTAGFYYQEVKREFVSSDDIVGETLINRYHQHNGVRSYRGRLFEKILLEGDTEEIITHEEFTYTPLADQQIRVLKREYSYAFDGDLYECSPLNDPLYSNPCYPDSLLMYYSMSHQTWNVNPYLLSQHSLSEPGYLGSDSTQITTSAVTSYDYSQVRPFPSEITINRYIDEASSPFSTEEASIRYAFDYDYSGAPQFIKDIVDNGISGLPVESWTIRDGKLTQATIIEYNGSGQPSKEFVYTGDFQGIPQWDNGFTYTQDFQLSDMTLERETLYDIVTLRPELIITPATSTLLLWGYNNTVPVARLINGTPGRLYHTSFEGEPQSVFDPQTSKTGRYYYVLNGAYTTEINLQPGNYIVTYYHRTNDQAPWVHITENVNLSTAGTISTNQTAGQIDELRIFPVGGLLTTYTYKPYHGLLTETDPNGKTTYYRYDSYGRPDLVRDDRGNIIRSIIYNSGR